MPLTQLLRAGLILGAMSAAALPVQAQQDRAAIIDVARAESDLRIALDAYLSAAEPLAIDSLWAVSVYEIAQILRDLDDEAASDTWLRWAARLSPQWPVDPDWFTPTLLTAYQAAVQAVGPSRGDSLSAETAWSWPDRYVLGSGGTIFVVATDPSIELTVTLDDGATTVSGPSALGAATGTHVVEVTALNHESRRFELEVLPGASVTLGVEMLPLLPAEASARAMSQVLRLRYTTSGSPVCTNAVSLNDGLLIGALQQLRGAADIELLLDDVVYDDLEIVEQDEEAGLAFVQLRNGPSLPLWTRSTAGTGFGWSVHRALCEADPVATRLRLFGTGETVGADLPAALLPSAAGAPVVDADGAMLGLISGDGRLAPVGRVEGLSQSVAARLGRGGFPFKWVGAGVAAAAGAFVYFLGGGENPSTGSIVIDIPTN